MKLLLKIGLVLLGFNSIAQTALPIPDTLSGPNYVLNMHKDSVQFFSGNISHTYAFNQYKYLGPTLIFNKGTNVNITVNNQIGDTTTVHWHGIHLPSMMDGGPHTTILPNAIWTPSFTVMDNAATYWYHPHFMGKTAKQVIKGAAGLIIVRDPIEAALTLPRKYGVDDFPLIIQCQQYDSLNQSMPLGMQDSTILVNGARASHGFTVNANFPAQIVRMRLLNASGERTFNFGFTANKQFKIIASDGGLLDNPVTTSRIRLSPGERAEILIDLNGMNGQILHLMGYASELAMGIQGGPTMPMPVGSPPMDSPLNGIDFNIMQITVTPQTTNPVTTIPSSLTTNAPYLSSQANITRTIRFTADSLMVMDGPFYFNGNSFDMMRIDYEIPLGSTEIWKLVNETMVAHPFHIHDVQFFLIDRSGNIPPTEELGRKDVVLVPPFDSVMFITKFEDFADTITPFMYHCHILMHEDDGMMGQFVVKPLSVGVNELKNNNNSFSIYPNPTNSIVNIDAKEMTSVSIFNTLGEMVYTQNKISTNSLQINTSQWSKGLYTVQVNSNNQSIAKKIIVN
ncbi:MAG: multicopper oxidase domain-containing protein [Bacteroidia bacterium]|jgi:blue copper oxidase|nr:multicopper oxidase domain-containing protein [Bacteroidia bacterium]